MKNKNFNVYTIAGGNPTAIYHNVPSNDQSDIVAQSLKNPNKTRLRNKSKHNTISRHWIFTRLKK
jgi:hypothetical protein